MTRLAVDIPQKTIQEWQSAVDLLARVAGVRAGLIMRLVGTDIEVLVSSSTADNPYHPGDRDHFVDSGLYCETVINTRDRLHVLDARLTEAFNQNPDLKLGMICYFGFPLSFPDGRPFGTICLLDDKPNSLSPDLIDLMEKIRSLIQSQLGLLEENWLQGLLANQTALRQILDHNPSAMCCCTLDPDAKVIYLNQKFAELFGYALSDLPNLRTWFALVYSNTEISAAGYRSREEAFEKALQEDNSPSLQELRLTGRDGRAVDVLISVRIVNDLRVISLLDITERKRAEQERQHTEEQLRLLTENIMDVIWVLNLNQMRFTYISPSILQLRGYTVEEALAEPLTASMVPESLAMVKEKIATGVPQFIADPSDSRPFVAEIQQPCKDGRIIWVEATTTYRFNAAHEIEVVGVSRNIDQRKTIEAQLRVSEERHRRLADNSADIIVTMDLKGHISYLSPSFEHLSGYTLAELAQLHRQDLLAPESYALARKAMADLRALPRSHQTPGQRSELQLRRKDGSLIWLEFTSSAIYAPDGQFIEILGIGRDISERKRYAEELQAAHAAVQTANAELEQRVAARTAELRESRDALSVANTALEKAVRARDEFMAAMSHELRTPLTGILGMAEVLQTPHYGDLSDKQTRAVLHIENSGRRLLEMVTRVLEYTHIQSGNVHLEFNRCSLAEICQAALQAVNPKARAKAQALEFTIPNMELRVWGDHHRLIQIVVNLLENAVKFTPPQGRIRLDVANDPDTGQVQIRVSDTGIGIQTEDFLKLFRPFVQLDTRLARRYEGAGLGLSLVKSLTELHGGQVTVESSAGHGSCFTVTLPDGTNLPFESTPGTAPGCR